MNIFQRGYNRKGGTHSSLQQGLLLRSLWCPAQHPGTEGKELSWGMPRLLTLGVGHPSEPERAAGSSSQINRSGG